MNVLSDLPPARAGEATSRPSASVLLHHPVFCQIGLPLRAPGRGVWRREVGPAAVSIEAGDEAPLPSGRYLRLLLIHIFDTAIRSDSHQVDLGEDVAALAARLPGEPKGPKLRELAEQVSRLATARFTVATEGGAPLSVFDARGRQRVAATGWRPTIRLNARFFATLGEGAVELDRDVVTALVDAPAALDLHAWLAWALPGGGPEGEVAASWDELRLRFGGTSQPAPEFRAGLPESLALLQQAWPVLTGVITDDGVAFRRATPTPTRENVADEADRAPRLGESPPAPPVDQPPAQMEPAAPKQPAPPPADPAVDQRPRTLRQTVSLRSHLTGLPQVVWLQRANGRDIVVIEVTPGGRYDPDSVTVIALEPVTLQVAGGLYARDFERVAAWATANRDLIEDWWEGRLETFEDVNERVRKVPAPGWR
jgi:hypothetical protein